MCGISGYITHKNFLKINSIKDTLKLMKRRGPDFSSHYKENLGSSELALLHTRLSIIDLNIRSNQPFVDKQFVLIFNGEIYNYEEIKKKLKKKNYKFKTNSDTEVLIKSYQEYGEDCVNHFVGMWAFAIWDLKKKKLFLSRDPFGEKPLYYFYTQNGFFFGSEIKFIRSLCNKEFEHNESLINKNLFSGYKSLNKDNQTFYKNIYSLNPSSNLKIDLGYKPKISKYWKPRIKINSKLKYNDAIEVIKSKLIKSISYRMISDVPLAFCLSGGVDSGILASHASKTLKKKVSTFSIIDDDQRYNELDNIKLITKNLNCNSNLIHISKRKNSFLNRLKKLTDYHDGPIATLSYYIHSFLSEQISKKGYKISISGTGADEIFTGYYDHYLLHFESIKNSKFFSENLSYWKKYVLPNIRNPYLKDPYHYIKNKNNRDLVYEKHLNVSKYAIIKKREKFTEIKFCKELLRNRMSNEMFNEVVPVILKHDDLNSMYHSIENRSPYLDRELYEFALTIPPQYLISKGYQKKILRDSAKGTLIDEIRLSRQKKGFNASINSIVNLNDKDIIKFIFDKKSPINNYIDLKKFKNDLNLSNIPNHFSKLIFNIISTKLFLEKK